MSETRHLSGLPRLSLTVCAGVVGIDALSKILVSRLLVPGQVRHVGGLLELDLYYNHAGASNALTGRPELVSALSLAAVLALALMATRARGVGYRVGLGLLLGGGVGNLADRLAGAPGPLRGGVIDWIRLFGSAGSMNLADLAINLGLVTLALAVLTGWWMERRGGARSPRTGTQTAESRGGSSASGLRAGPETISVTGEREPSNGPVSPTRITAADARMPRLAGRPGRME